MIALVEQAMAGDRRALARLMTAVENDPSVARDAIREIYARTGRAHTVGVTGAPGSGKSTLVARIAAAYRARGHKVGIVAVDPSSPFSGGALLGDRVRMGSLAGDRGVFVRSMASRGSLGGLARGTLDMVRLLDAAGYDRVVIETVGAGQSEVDIARAAHTTLVIQVPGMGDTIQTLKAGILEIADLLVVNKADHVGADRTAAALEAMLDLGHDTARSVETTWRPPVLKTVASGGVGIKELVDAIERHMAYWHRGGGRERERERAERELFEILRSDLSRRVYERVGRDGIDEAIARILARQTDPYAAAGDLLRRAGLGSGHPIRERSAQEEE